MKPAEEEWDQTDIRLATAKTLNKCQAKTVRHTLSAGTKLCLLAPDIVCRE
jgi:hypothetical protein